MTKKEHFIKMVENFLDTDAEIAQCNPEAMAYFETLKAVKETKKQEITDNGKNIILFMQANEEKVSNLFYAKNIAEGMFISSRAVSGAMRKLVSDGYVDKITESPIVYSITEKGKALIFNV